MSYVSKQHNFPGIADVSIGCMCSKCCQAFGTRICVGNPCRSRWLDGFASASPRHQWGATRFAKQQCGLVGGFRSHGRRQRSAGAGLLRRTCGRNSCARSSGQGVHCPKEPLRSHHRDGIRLSPWAGHSCRRKTSWKRRGQRLSRLQCLQQKGTGRVRRHTIPCRRRNARR